MTNMSPQKKKIPTVICIGIILIQLTVCCMTAYLIGLMLIKIIPCPEALAPGGWKMLLGAVFQTIIYLVLRFIKKQIFLHRLQQVLDSIYNSVPKSIGDFRKFNVRNPVDFCFVMYMFSNLTPVVNGIQIRNVEVFNMDVFYDKESEIFARMFNRMPLRSELKNWEVTFMAECANMKDCDSETISIQSCRKMVSPGTIKAFSLQPMLLNFEPEKD